MGRRFERRDPRIIKRMIKVGKKETRQRQLDHS